MSSKSVKGTKGAKSAKTINTIEVTEPEHVTTKEYDTTTNFYEQLDIVFDKLYKKYGFNDELIGYKGDLLHIYENEHKYRSAEILKLIQPKHFYIDENGYVVSK